MRPPPPPHPSDDAGKDTKPSSSASGGASLAVVRRVLELALDAFMLVTQGLGVALALGLALNIGGWGYELSGGQIVVKPLSEMRQESSDRRFARDAVRLLRAPAAESKAPPPEPDTVAAELLRLRGGGAGSGRIGRRRRDAAMAREGRGASLRAWVAAYGEACVHVAICAWCLRGAAESVRVDQWQAIRLAPAVVEQRGDAILKRRRRAAQVGQLLGAGYTPRITFLAGLMLRSLQAATRLRGVFDPSLGYAAGASLAASFSRREWLCTLLLGWGFGGVYWSALGVRPPGVPREASPLLWH